MTTNSNRPPKEQWPSVDVAYGFVMPSYQMLASRFEAADGRLTALLTMASTLSFAAPLLARSVRPDISFKSVWFIAGIFLFIGLVLVGLIGRIKGVLTLPDPMVFYKTSLDESEWAFKKNAIYFAGLHFEKNAEMIRTKGNLSIAMTLILALEVGAFVLWVST